MTQQSHTSQMMLLKPPTNELNSNSALKTYINIQKGKGGIQVDLYVTVITSVQ